MVVIRFIIVPANGSYLSLDPSQGTLNSPISQNGYTYANNNPVMFVDPEGEFSINLLTYTWSSYNDIHVKNSALFLSKAFCLGFAAWLIQVHGSGPWWYRTFAGYNAVQLATECYTHALVHFVSGAEYLLIRHGIRNLAHTSVIDIDPNDSRSWEFMIVWDLY